MGKVPRISLTRRPVLLRLGRNLLFLPDFLVLVELRRIRLVLAAELGNVWALNSSTTSTRYLFRINRQISASFSLYRHPVGRIATSTPFSERYSVALIKKAIAVLAWIGPLGVWTSILVPPRQLNGGFSTNRFTFPWAARNAWHAARDLSFQRSHRPILQAGLFPASRRIAVRSISVARNLERGQIRSAAKSRAPSPAARSAISAGLNLIAGAMSASATSSGV